MPKKRVKRVKRPLLTEDEKKINAIFNAKKHNQKKKAMGFTQITVWVPKTMRKALISRVHNIVKEYKILGINDENYKAKMAELEKLKEDHGDYEIHYVEDENE